MRQTERKKAAPVHFVFSQTKKRELGVRELKNAQRRRHIRKNGMRSGWQKKVLCGIGIKQKVRPIPLN